jgi:hypothetical protein
VEKGVSKTEEIWKPIKDYEGLYEVSNFGRVRNCRSYSPHTTSNKTKFGKLKTQRENNCGYLRVCLSNSGVHKDFFVHRLVAEVFIENPEGKPAVNHIDGDKKNNHFNNLEWVSYSENTRHAYKNNLISTISDKKKISIKKAQDMSKKKVLILDKKSGEKLGVFSSLTEASLYFGFHDKYFSNARKRGHGKFKAVILGDDE